MPLLKRPRPKPGQPGQPGQPGRPRAGDAAGVLRWCRDMVAATAAREEEMRARADGEFPSLTAALRARLDGGELLDGLLPEAFAAVREAAARTLGQRHFDVQIMGGAVLHLGQAAEMRTGEGKTLTATLPAYLNALTGDGVHVITANDYLAGRDGDWMGPVYRFLGLAAGQLRPGQEPAERRPQYLADVTYGPWEEFGYDYLRDNLSWEPGELVQRGLHLAIVDEADLILLDECRTPLLITGPAPQDRRVTLTCAKIAAVLEPGRHYDVDPLRRAASLTEEGSRKIEKALELGNLYDEANLRLVHCLQNALLAKEFNRKDRDYVIDGDQAVIIDQTSGRPHHGRRYGEGLHEAIEAKEGLPVREARQVLARVPVRDYLSRYRGIAAMTGTAAPEAEAYRTVYGLEVVTIPTNRPMIRVDHADAVYHTRAAKLAALADEAAARNARSQPVLVGAASIEQAEEISRLLAGRGIGHEVLTAKNHAREAEIISGAARLAAVTVVAQMAGRGTDIVLGGADGAERDAVADRGGLCVLGAERSASRRAELHLRGRAGRQGDPGESRFFLSFEDDLVKVVMRLTPAALMNRSVRDGDPFKRLSQYLDNVQARQAAQTAQSMAELLGYDAVLAGQQHEVYAERRAAFEGSGLPARVRAMIGQVIRAEVADAARQHLGNDRLWGELGRLFPVTVTPESLAAERGCDVARIPPGYVADRVTADAGQAYDRREAELGPPTMRELERRVTLSVFDRAWREHLEATPDLLKSVGLRTPGGKAPLPDYRREAAQSFAAMRAAMSKEIVRSLFNMQIENRRDEG
jgi:preprotein translocase subunit SecA